MGASGESLQTKIDDLAGSAATAEAELTAATAFRAKEHADFQKSEKELLDVIDTLGRAIVIIEKEMKGGASMMQLQRAGSVIEALSVMVQATSINSADATKLTALVQNSQNSDDEDDIDATGAPAATVYKSHSGSIVETLEDLKAKAEAQLAEARQTEATASHNFQMLQQSLEDEMKFNAQDLEASKSALTETQSSNIMEVSRSHSLRSNTFITMKGSRTKVGILGDLHLGLNSEIFFLSSEMLFRL